MKIAQFTQFLMKVNGLNPIFPNRGTMCHRIFEMLKLFIFLLPAIYETFSTIAYAFVYLTDIKKSTRAMYLTIGYLMSISMHIALWIDSFAIHQLLNKIENLINQRIIAGMGARYKETNNDLEKRTRQIFKVWLSLVISVLAVPFLSAFIDYIMGRFSIKSWKLLHNTTLNIGFNMSNENHLIFLIFAQFIAASIIVWNIIVPQFIYLVIVQFEAAFVDDIILMLQGFNKLSGHCCLKNKLIEVVHLQRNTYEILVDYGKIMNTPIFIVNTMNLSCMCMIFFQIKYLISAGAYDDLHGTIVANFTILQLVFLFCYLGDRLTTKMIEINDAIYDIPWYNYPIDIQKFIIPIIQRSQKKFILMGYSLTSLSLHDFKQMMTFIISAFLVLLNLDS